MTKENLYERLFAILRDLNSRDKDPEYALQRGVYIAAMCELIKKKDKEKEK